MDNAIEVNKLNKKYDGFTLDNISFFLPKGVIMGLIGENGAGKSTTINCILELVKYSWGDIKIFGEQVPLSPKRKESIGVVLEHYNLPTNLKPKDINSIMKDVYQNWQEKTFFDYLDKFSLPKKKTVKHFSSGMKVKLSLAVALSHQAKLLILDETTSGLDPVTRDEISEIMLDFIQDEECSVLICSHLTSDLERIADYITYIHQGKVLFSKTRDELTESYAKVQFTQNQFDNFDKERVVGYRSSKYGIDALVINGNYLDEYICEKPTIEEIMLYYCKEDKR